MLLLVRHLLLEAMHLLLVANIVSARAQTGVLHRQVDAERQNRSNAEHAILFEAMSWFDHRYQVGRLEAIAINSKEYIVASCY